MSRIDMNQAEFGHARPEKFAQNAFHVFRRWWGTHGVPLPAANLRAGGAAGLLEQACGAHGGRSMVDALPFVPMKSLGTNR